MNIMKMNHMSPTFLMQHSILLRIELQFWVKGHMEMGQDMYMKPMT